MQSKRPRWMTGFAVWLLAVVAIAGVSCGEPSKGDPLEIPSEYSVYGISWAGLDVAVPYPTKWGSPVADSIHPDERFVAWHGPRQKSVQPPPVILVDLYRISGPVESQCRKAMLARLGQEYADEIEEGQAVGGRAWLFDVEFQTPAGVTLPMPGLGYLACVETAKEDVIFVVEVSAVADQRHIAEPVFRQVLSTTTIAPAGGGGSR